MASASQFYRNHYGGDLRVGAVPLKLFEEQMLSTGGQYALASEYLDKVKPNGATLAELGCGGAEALLILSNRHQFGRTVGIDVALPREEFEYNGIQLKSGDLDDVWPLENGSIDFLLAMMVIEQLYNPFHSFGEIKRVLSPNGVAFVNLPLVTGLRNRIRLAAGKLPITSVAYDGWFSRKEWDGNHLHYFSMSSIRRLANSCDLAVRRVRGVGRWYKMKTAFPSILASEVTFELVHQLPA